MLRPKIIVPKKYAKLGELVAVDGSLADATLSMYCAEEHGERVNMNRVRELRNTIQNELRSSQMETTNFNKQKRKKQLHART